MDKKRILTLVDFIENYTQELEQHLPPHFKVYNQNIEKQRFCERTLQLLIEVCIDVAHLLVKELKLGLPDEEETVFEKLKDREIISEEMYLKLKQMKKFRNVLIHRYTKIDNSLVYLNATENAGDFQTFKQEILAFLREEKKEQQRKNKREKQTKLKS